jgi:hypothetical protein
VLARHLGRAVRWTGDRLEDLASTSHGFDEIVDAELALDKDGRILALAAEVIGDIGAYSIFPWTAALEPVQVVSFMPGPYRAHSRRPSGFGHGGRAAGRAPRVVGLSRQHAEAVGSRHWRGAAHPRRPSGFGHGGLATGRAPGIVGLSRQAQLEQLRGAGCTKIYREKVAARRQCGSEKCRGHEAAADLA